MSEIIKICAIAVAGILLISLVKTYRQEFTVPLILCVSLIILWTAADGLKYAFTYMQAIYGQFTSGKEYFRVVVKVLAIAYITEFTVSLCEDAGQSSIGKKVELAGKISVFFVAIPVFTSIFSLLAGIIQGR